MESQDKDSGRRLGKQGRFGWVGSFRRPGTSRPISFAFLSGGQRAKGWRVGVKGWWAEEATGR
jgi:hypothetical protein